jgi:repressor LexA
MKGTELRKIREELGLTQDELAKALSVAANTVARWERGERKIPNHLPLAMKTVVAEQQAKTVELPENK